ncbi:MAG: hypothetical protein JRJ59_10475 [Deltaproteobacteria bacterium]|nr:hypothetical protein [Deltaproteobacteria bacterium]
MRLGRNISEFRIGTRIFYMWLIQTLALIVALLIIMMIVESLGGWFTTRELRMLVAGLVIGFSVSSYRLMKQKVSWNQRGAEMEKQIRELKAEKNRDRLAAASKMPCGPPS